MSATTTSQAPGLYDDIPEAGYHEDPALSQSGAKLLLDTPARYRHRMDTGPQFKTEFNFGHAAHKLVLGVGGELVRLPEGNGNLKAVKDAKEQALTDGAIPLKPAEWDTVHAMAQALKDHALAGAILASPGRPEVSMWWEETSDLGAVPCRGRIDYLTADATGRPVIVDYKTTTDASPTGFAGLVAKYRYDMQSAAYRRGHTTLTGHDPLYVLIAQEKEPPYLPAVYALGVEFYDRGTRAWERAVDLYATCTTTNTWPGYPAGITELEPPRWATYQD